MRERGRNSINTRLLFCYASSPLFAFFNLIFYCNKTTKFYIFSVCSIQDTIDSEKGDYWLLLFRLFFSLLCFIRNKCKFRHEMENRRKKNGIKVFLEKPVKMFTALMFIDNREREREREIVFWKLEFTFETLSFITVRMTFLSSDRWWNHYECHI